MDGVVPVARVLAMMIPRIRLATRDEADDPGDEHRHATGLAQIGLLDRLARPGASGLAALASR